MNTAVTRWPLPICHFPIISEYGAMIILLMKQPSALPLSLFNGSFRLLLVGRCSGTENSTGVTWRLEKSFCNRIKRWRPVSLERVLDVEEGSVATRTVWPSVYRLQVYTVHFGQQAEKEFNKHFDIKMVSSDTAVLAKSFWGICLYWIDKKQRWHTVNRCLLLHSGGDWDNYS